MDINDKLLAWIWLISLGLGSAKSSSVSKADRMSDLAEKYKGKSDQETDLRDHEGQTHA